MENEKVEIRHRVDLGSCTVAASNLHGPHIIILYPHASILASFSSREEMELLARAIDDVKNNCFPIDNCVDKQTNNHQTESAV